MVKILVAFCVSLSFYSSAYANVVSSNLSQTATLSSSCSITKLQDAVIDQADPLNKITDDLYKDWRTTGLLKLVCTKGTYTLQVNAGTHLESSTCQRRLKNQNQNVYMGYNIMYDQVMSANHFMPQSCGGFVSLGSLTFSTQAEQTFPVYIRIWETRQSGNAANPSGYSIVTPGVYSDTLTVQVTF